MRRYYFTHFTMIATNNGGTGDATPPVGDPANPPKTYTKDEVDNMLKTETTTIKRERDNLIQQYETLKKTAGLSQNQIKDLQGKIDELKTSHLSTEQKAALELDRQKKEYGEEKDSLTKDRDHWRGEYDVYRKQTELHSAAAGANAFNPQQLVNLLATKTKLVESKEVVEGQETTVYKTIVQFDDKDKDGKPVVVELSPSDAIKRMKELPEQFGNLFKTDAKGGTGLMNNNPGTPGNKNGFREGMSFSEYKEFRKTANFGSKIK